MRKSKNHVKAGDLGGTRISGWAGLGTLLIAAPLMFPPSAVTAQVTNYPATTRSNTTVLPIMDYTIAIPNLTILSGYDFATRSAKDFIPFAENLGFNVQVVGDLTGTSWSIVVYTPGNTNPIMEIDAHAGASTGQPAGTRPLMCAWGPNKTATVDFGEDQKPTALVPPSGCPNAIFVQVSPNPGFLNSPAFAAFPNNPILQNAQDAINFLNSQLSSIPNAPQLIFAPPGSPNCAKIMIIPSATSTFPVGTMAEEQNMRFLFGIPLAPNGLIRIRNDEIANPTDYAAGPLLEHEILHALGIGHTGEAMGHAPMYSSTDIMSLTGTSNLGFTSVFIPLTADEKQALTEIYGNTSITLSASQRQKFCQPASTTQSAAGGGSTGSGTGGTGTGGSGSGSCLLTCSSPFVVEPNSCSCVCGKTSSACFPNFVDTQSCQCYSVKSTLLTCDPSIVCPAGSFADPTVNCQCVAEIGAQGTGSCDPSKQVTDPDTGAVSCGE